MRESSVFTFLKSKVLNLYELCVVMEKFIVLKKYKLAAATSKVILDVFNQLTDNDFEMTIDVFCDPSVNITSSTVKSLHELLFEYIYDDYFKSSEEFLVVDYEFDFTFLGDNPKITNDDIYLIFKNLKVNSITPRLLNMQSDDLIAVEDLNTNDKKEALKIIKKNLDDFIKGEILTLTLFDSEENILNSKLNFEAVVKSDYCAVREIPLEVDLDEYQKSAVEYDDKALVISAGPGAGKTRVIIERVVYLITNGASPDSILVITFTNKAADELRERFKKRH